MYNPRLNDALVCQARRMMDDLNLFLIFNYDTPHRARHSLHRYTHKIFHKTHFEKYQKGLKQ